MLFSQQSVSDKQMNQWRKMKKRLKRMFMYFGKHLESHELHYDAVRSFDF
jgi:hypothetical protein